MTESRGNNPVYSKSGLDDAVEEEKSLIVIKDSKLGNRTVLWIHAGKCLSAMTLVAAVGSVICSINVNCVSDYAKPLAVGSVLMNIGYQLLWNPDPLMAYRVSQGLSLLSFIGGNHPPSTILVRREPCSHTIFNTLACVFAVVTAFWEDIKSFNFKSALEELDLSRQDHESTI